MGACISQQDKYRACVWTPAGAKELGTVDELENIATGINQHDQIVGHIIVGQEMYHACIWKKDKCIDISQRCPGNSNTAIAVNNLGTILGNMGGDDSPRSFLLANNTTFLLPLYNKQPFTAEYLSLNTNQIVGSASVKKFGKLYIIGLLWNGNKYIHLQSLGGSVTTPSYISPNGHIILGQSFINYSEAHACMWVDQKPIDLNTITKMPPGCYLDYAVYKNDNGDILCLGFNGVKGRTFLLKPIDP